MTKAELTARIADKVQLTNRQAEAVVGIILACIAEALREGDQVELRGFGSFRTRSRGARQGRNPRTGDVVQVPARNCPFSGPARIFGRKWAFVKTTRPKAPIGAPPGRLETPARAPGTPLRSPQGAAFQESGGETGNRPLAVAFRPGTKPKAT